MSKLFHSKVLPQNPKIRYPIYTINKKREKCVLTKEMWVIEFELMHCSSWCISLAKLCCHTSFLGGQLQVSWREVVELVEVEDCEFVMIIVIVN